VEETKNGLTKCKKGVIYKGGKKMGGQILLTIIGAILSVILTAVFIQNGKYIRQNGEAIRQNGEAIRQNGEAIRQNGEAIRQNGEAIRELIEKLAELIVVESRKTREVIKQNK
jgi:uncharacterized membrane protein YgaE (UPF0421/DUF939 family)